MWLLDANVCIQFLKGNNAMLLERFTAIPQADKYLCSVVAGELYYGACKSQRIAENMQRFEQFIARFPMLVFDRAAARHFGEIRAVLARKGTPIGPYDLQIAAIALANGCTLVTHNTVEFSRVGGLKLEDWEVSGCS
ncbi:MAG: type II toxin-antitoxin system VapC family toxin [Candidatus Competibacter sp.]|nr:type II toxin-antitoxin system VapC family toxin [Candidatus Competibacter sp.]